MTRFWPMGAFGQDLTEPGMWRDCLDYSVCPRYDTQTRIVSCRGGCAWHLNYGVCPDNLPQRIECDETSRFLTPMDVTVRGRPEALAGGFFGNKHSRLTASRREALSFFLAGRPSSRIV